MKKLFKIFTKRKKEEAIQEELDNIFDLWAIILNFGGFVTLIFTYNMQAEYSSASVTGFLFMFTIVLSLFEMMVAAARPVALARLATYLHYLLTFPICWHAYVHFGHGCQVVGLKWLIWAGKLGRKEFPRFLSGKNFGKVEEWLCQKKKKVASWVA